MANGRKPVDLGFAEFAAQVVAELHEGLLVAQDEQESRRAKLAELSSLPLEEFARRFITNEQVEAELVRLFPAARGKAGDGAEDAGCSTQRAEGPCCFGGTPRRGQAGSKIFPKKTPRRTGPGP